jgi:hypothetical protein
LQYWCAITSFFSSAHLIFGQQNILAQHNEQADFWVAVDKELNALRTEHQDRSAISRCSTLLRIAYAMLTFLLSIVSKILHDNLTHYGDFNLELVAGTQPSDGQDIADNEVVNLIRDPSPVQEDFRLE